MNRPVTKQLRLRAAAVFMIIVLAALLALPKSATAQPLRSAELENYSTFLYNNANGLPTSEANAIVQSKDGYIFIGSYSGLTFYDGVSFTRFSSQTGITSVVSLFIDKDDRLWIGTNDSGIVLFEKSKYTFYGRDAGLASLSVRSITQDDSGRIIFATTEGVAYINEDGTVRSIDDPVVNGKYLKQLTRCVNGVIYGCTLDGVCFSLEDLKITSSFDSKSLGIGVANCITPDPKTRGKVWVGTNESDVICGDIFAEMSNRNSFSVAPSHNINAVCPTDSGAFWICTDSGIGMLNNGTYKQYSDFPMNNSVENVMTDYEGNLWFVSSRQGVMKVVHSEFSNLSEKAGLKELVVNSTCLYNGDLYIGTDSGLIVLDPQGEPKTTKLTENLDGVRIRCIKPSESGGKLWLCTYSDKGLICYNGSDESCEYFNSQNGTKSDRVRAMTELSDGTIVAATSGGVVFIKDGVIERTFDESNGIGNTEILTVCEGDNGHVYMGSDGGGIVITDREKVIGRLGFDDGLKSEIILRIKKDPKTNNYWVITGNSIAYMENEKMRTISGFPYSNNFDIFFDNQDRIWILSSNGIYTVNRDNMLGNGKIEYSFYDVNCGLPSAATANSYSCVSEDGMLYIAGVTGVSSININDQQNAASGIKLSVPYIEVDDVRIDISDQNTVKIPADCKRLTIYAFAPTFLLTSPRLSYCLEGFDDNKITFAKHEMQPISYTNLKSGKYTFRFSVVDTMTGEDTETFTVDFIKEKALVEELWFRVVIVFVIIAAIMLTMIILGKVKNHHLLKKQEEDRVFVNQIIKAFAKCIDLKDKYTNGHSFRVAKYASMIAEKMGYDEQQVTDIYNIGLLHDIGKIAVPDKILGKPQKLSEEEFEIISQHAMNGYEILKEIEIRPDLAIGAGYHHEHVDGTGYPFGKKGDEIPPIAQIIAVADTFDAMNSTRPYRKQLYAEVIIDEMIRISGTQLNTNIVGLFLDIIREGKLDNVLVWENKVKGKTMMPMIDASGEIKKPEIAPENSDKSTDDTANDSEKMT
ncbi:MAG: HD domain-containing protein [Oscillospiraceae bacterium]|nr:HD domain-containing protein [Oscillospiraceae bacterium]